MIKALKERYLNPLMLKSKPKYFCLGLNKTGTTSLAKAFSELNFVVGNQSKAERLVPDIFERRFDKLFKYCKSAEVFQDVPFSFTHVVEKLYQEYPNAKFILTVRDSPEQWVHSITNFHAKKFSHGKVASSDDLKSASYVWKGWIWDVMKFNFDVDERDPYNKDHLAKAYKTHNEYVRALFKDSDNFLELNLADEGSYQDFTDFIKVKSKNDSFPWENKTEPIIK